MATINPLEHFQIEASSFGASLSISWHFPIDVPANKRTYLFKRSNTDVTDAEITAYFLAIADLSHFTYNGLMVYDGLQSDTCAIGDNVVKNDTQYFYKAVLRDETTGDYSTAVSGNATPHPEFKVNVKDGKEIIFQALTKLFDNVYTSDGLKVQMGKDIQLVKNFSIEPISENYVMIERVNGTTQHSFWSNELYQYQGKIVKGDIDLDVIRATFITQESPERRDKVANIFRANKQFLIHMVKRLGAKDCKITIEGDYYNPQIHGVNAVGFIIVFSMLIENKMMIPRELFGNIVGDLTVVEEIK